MKPFNPRELVARVKAVLRRSRAGVRGGQVVEVGGVRIDPARREVWVESEPGQGARFTVSLPLS